MKGAFFSSCVICDLVFLGASMLFIFMASTSM
uniref:Uncharacterized protein n=1 Tax=Arundo donax TaxID=35708 RepID=A0A0A9B0U0_ARUDO